MSRSLNVDISGKVRKIRSKEPLLPLFEAVVNSIQAIEALDSRNGKILIHINRESVDNYFDLGKTIVPDVIGFTITDNGIGFDDSNFNSFCTSDSTLKIELGGKGIGRFSWLKFFTNVQIKSTFKQSGQTFQRGFTFETTGIDNGEKKEVFDAPLKTEIALLNFRQEFSKKCPNDAEIIANRLVEHLISYFATSSCPAIELIDNDIRIDLEHLFQEKFGKYKKSFSFEIGDKKFKTSNFRIYEGNQVHKFLLCADKRVAQEISLQKSDAILGRKLEDKNGNNFAYWVYVEGDYLNNIVNDDREGFRFLGDDNTADLLGEISQRTILNTILPIIYNELADELRQVKDSNKTRVNQYIEEKAPEYRTLNKLHPEKISQINKSTDKEIDAELRKILFDVETELRENTQAVLKMNTNSHDSIQEFETKINKILDVINDVGKASLSKYVIQRRVILDILKKRMEFEETGKYHLEKAIHELIFPLGKTSEDIPFEKQNLWIIDERLSYHSYLGSDKNFNSLLIDASASNVDRADIILFNKPIALDSRSEVGRPFESIEIIEFKRPGRDNYTDTDNPALQVMKYIEAIQEGKEKNYRGRPIEVTPNTHFCCYIMCDVTEKLKKILKRSAFFETPDDQGLFCFAQSHNAYIEVMSYNKMLRLAEQRNRILFDKLQIKH